MALKGSEGCENWETCPYINKFKKCMWKTCSYFKPKNRT